MINCKIYYLDTEFVKISEQENGARITVPVKLLKQHFSDSYFVTNNDIIYDKNIIEDYLKEVYSEKYLQSIQNFKFKRNAKTGYYNDNYDLTITTNTYNEIILSNALILQAFNDIYNKKNKYAYCLVRPPSYHAAKDHPAGFCYINNTFMIAQHAVKYGGFNKVLIFDYDLHHGDGTEKLCKDYIKNNGKNNIHFISMHHYSYGEYFYPGTGRPAITEDIANYGLKKHSTEDDAEYIMHQIYDKILDEEYDLIIISNGFDAHKDDLYETINFDNNYYKNVAHKLKGCN